MLTAAARRLLPPTVWRRTHLLVYLAWPLALLHGLGMGSDTTQRAGPHRSACAAALAVFLAVVGHAGPGSSAAVRSVNSAPAAAMRLLQACLTSATSTWPDTSGYTGR